MLTVKIERMADLFDEDVIEEMLEDCEENCCHFNAANVCRLFEDWDCFDYVEGYILGHIGHAINMYRDYKGACHYFDPTQESNIRKGLERYSDFVDEFDVVDIFSYEKINDIFSKDGETHLVSVSILNG